jgi:hypothetical protein
MLQDFHLKFFHCVGAKHSTVDGLSRNPMKKYEIDEDFGNEI